MAIHIKLISLENLRCKQLYNKSPLQSGNSLQGADVTRQR